MSKVRPVPEGFRTITPHLTVKGAAKAIDFYQRAFGAELVTKHEMPGTGAIMHAQLMIGDSSLMLNDEFPQGASAPSDSSPVTIHVYTEDADALFARATKAGATVVFPLENAFWGDRYGLVKDPFGHSWSIATRVEDLKPDEVMARAAKAFGGC